MYYIETIKFDQDDVDSETEGDYDLFVKFSVFIMSFVKCLHLISVYEEYGFLIKMMILCIYDLIPFILSYIFFAIYFAMLYASMGIEIESDLHSSKDLGYFSQIFLSVWRNSVGKLGFVRYGQLMERDHTFFRDSQVYMI